MKLAKEILGLKGNEIWSVDPDSTVLDALKLMAEKDIGAVLVMHDEKLVGIISEAVSYCYGLV